MARCTLPATMLQYVCLVWAHAQLRMAPHPIHMPCCSGRPSRSAGGRAGGQIGSKRARSRSPEQEFESDGEQQQQQQKQHGGADEAAPRQRQLRQTVPLDSTKRLLQEWLRPGPGEGSHARRVRLLGKDGPYPRSVGFHGMNRPGDRKLQLHLNGTELGGYSFSPVESAVLADLAALWFPERGLRQPPEDVGLKPPPGRGAFLNFPRSRWATWDAAWAAS